MDRHTSIAGRLGLASTDVRGGLPRLAAGAQLWHMPRKVQWEPPTVPFRAEHVPVDGQFLRRAALRGAIVRLAHGVYVAARGAATTHADQHLQQALAYQLAFPTPIVASHETAAVALGLPLPHPDALPELPRFTLDPACGSRRHTRPRIRVTALPESQVVTLHRGPHEGLRVTSPERTALDLAAELPLPFALMAMDAVARSRALTMSAPWALRGQVDDRILQESLAGLHAVDSGLGRRGARRRRIAMALVDARHESAAESASVGGIYLAGLPLPVPQARFETTQGRYYPDFYWPTWGIVGECDGAVKYRGGDSAAGQVAADKRRIQEKRRALCLEREFGVQVVPWFGYEAMYDPDAFLAPLAAALRRRGASW